MCYPVMAKYAYAYIRMLEDKSMTKIERILICCVWELLICMLTIVANQCGELVPDRTDTIKKLTEVTNQICEYIKEAKRNEQD